MTHNALLSLSGVHLRRGGDELYGGRDFSVDAGQLVWLRGANGAGKTTLLRILAGLLAPDRGRLRWKGQDFASRLDEPSPALALLDERLGLCRDLSVRQNLEYFQALGGSHVTLEDVMQRLGLLRLVDRPVGQLSTGQRKRVGLGRLMVAGATVWLLDEPVNGLDADNRIRLGEEIVAHAGRGGTVIFASHDPIQCDGVQQHEWMIGA